MCRGIRCEDDGVDGAGGANDDEMPVLEPGNNKYGSEVNGKTGSRAIRC